MEKIAQLFAKKIRMRGCPCRVKKQPKGFKSAWYLKRFDIVARFGVLEPWEWDMADTIIERRFYARKA